MGSGLIHYLWQGLFLVSPSFFDVYLEDVPTRYAGVMTALEARAGKRYGSAEVSLKALAADTGLTIRTVQRHLDYLDRKAWITRGRKQSFQGSSVYYLLTTSERTKRIAARDWTP